MKKSILFIECLILLFLAGCNQSLYDKNSLQEEQELNLQTKEEAYTNDILSAFKFWVNRNAWLYGHLEYVNMENKVDIYYKEEEDGYLGYLYFPNIEDGEKVYKQFSFYFGEDGFRSHPFTETKTKKIEKNLIFLKQANFCLKRTDISKPMYPPASKKKLDFISKGKDKIKEILSSQIKKNDEYQVYILDCTNEDITAEVIVIENNKEMWLGEISNQIQMDDGTIKEEIDFIGRGPVIDWADEQNRKNFEKELELSISEFTVKN